MLEQTQMMIESYLDFFGEHAFLQALVILCLSFLIAWVFNRYVIAALHKLAQKTKGHFDDQLIDFLHRPLFNTVLLLGLASAVTVMHTSDRVEYTTFSVLQTAAILLWTQFALQLVNIALSKFAQDEQRLTVLSSQTLPLFKNLANIVILVMAVYLVFCAWEVDMTAWLASAGVVGIAIGFAAKDTLANLFSGIFIMADSPYKIGDFVVLGTGERGEITHIGIRSTRMLTRDDVEVTIPNSVMGNTTIVNETGGPHKKYRIRVKIGVAYGVDIDLVRETLLSIAKQEVSVCNNPEPRVRFRNFGASSLDLELLCWVEEPVLRGRVIDALNWVIYKQFRELNIEIPYCKQDLYIKEMPPR